MLPAYVFTSWTSRHPVRTSEMIGREAVCHTLAMQSLPRSMAICSTKAAHSPRSQHAVSNCTEHVQMFLLSQLITRQPPLQSHPCETDTRQRANSIAHTSDEASMLCILPVLDPSCSRGLNSESPGGALNTIFENVTASLKTQQRMLNGGPKQVNGERTPTCRGSGRILSIRAAVQQV